MSWLNGIEFKSSNELQSEQNKKNAENSEINRKILDDLQKFIDNQPGLASETYPIPNRTNLETELLEENGKLKTYNEKLMNDNQKLKRENKNLNNTIVRLKKKSTKGGSIRSKKRNTRKSKK